MALGYLNRPELTRTKFIQSPFPEKAAGTMYKTGDLVRWFDDGTIAFLGRTDNQVKVRGFRIEPEEIEYCLAGHPFVKQAVVAVKKDSTGQNQLVGYIVPDLEAATDRNEKKDCETSLLDWHRAIHNHYTDMDVAELTFNISGWNSSYTGQPIPSSDMRQWAERTAEQIIALKPVHVLEIGCGTGLILSRVAPVCKSYVGIDFSTAALDFTRQMINKTKNLSHVRVQEQEARDFRGFEKETVDTIIINSVIQYFPDAAYILEVIKNALIVLKPGGKIFIGDVRNLKLQKEFYVSVERFKRGPSADVKDIIAGVNHAKANEEELFVDPDFFYDLRAKFPETGHIAVRPKPGQYRNEMSLYRYDVVIYKQAVLPGVTVNKGPVETIHELVRMIREHPGIPIKIESIANARNQKDQWMMQQLENHMAGDKAESFLNDPDIFIPAGIEPEDIIKVCRSLSVTPEFFISGKYHFDLIVQPENAPLVLTEKRSDDSIDRPDKKASPFTNQPALGIFMKKLVPGVRAYLRNHLPGHMVPSFLLVLESLPLLPGGKIDRKALPDPLSMNMRIQGGNM
ncbi:MAG: methyltransferase [Proteobacteria bacterium]|nr:methyltransferase [Pseudomonadota bacterium]